VHAKKNDLNRRQVFIDKKMLKVKKLNPEATLPTRGSPYAAGLDLYALNETMLPPHTGGLVETGIAVAIPPEFYGRIAPRSGVSFKTGLVVNAGVIDSDYRGEVKVLFNNYTDNEVKFQKGDKVAQLVLERIGLLAVEEVEDLDETVRGENGFGSTGV
jgi:deoxyuridine 5'-triphosphate nucleotidohydrolase